VAAIGCSLNACDFFQTGCRSTAQERFNPCLTVSGSEELPDSLLYVRERQGGLLDTLRREPFQAKCFPERRGTQRFFVYDGDSLLLTTEWITLKSEGCDEVEDRTVDLAL
jgi:hypothetical protein